MNYDIGTVVFDNWVIVEKIGEGTYGQVYKITKTDFGITVESALKVITIPKSPSDIKSAMNEGMDERSVTTYFQGFVDEVVKEIATLAKLKDCNNIVSYEDHAKIGHRNAVGWDILIRMELLYSLDDYKMSKNMKESEVIVLAKDMCHALIACQRNGIVHRDIKPANIFINNIGTFKLGDFGVARTMEKTTGASKKGTENYMAPEVYLVKPYNANVDIYSLGIVLYQIMNKGRLPFLPNAPLPVTFADREKAILLRMKGNQIPPPCLAAPAFAGIILKACAYDPRARYQSAAEMLDDLNRLSYTESSNPQNNSYSWDNGGDNGTHGIFGNGAGRQGGCDDGGTQGIFGNQNGRNDRSDGGTQGIFGNQNGRNDGSDGGTQGIFGSQNTTGAKKDIHFDAREFWRSRLPELAWGKKNDNVFFSPNIKESIQRRAMKNIAQGDKGNLIGILSPVSYSPNRGIFGFHRGTVGLVVSDEYICIRGSEDMDGAVIRADSIKYAYVTNIDRKQKAFIVQFYQDMSGGRKLKQLSMPYIDDSYPFHYEKLAGIMNELAQIYGNTG